MGRLGGIPVHSVFALGCWGGLSGGLWGSLEWGAEVKILLFPLFFLMKDELLPVLPSPASHCLNYASTPV